MLRRRRLHHAGRRASSHERLGHARRTAREALRQLLRRAVALRDLHRRHLLLRLEPGEVERLRLRLARRDWVALLGHHAGCGHAAWRQVELVRIERHVGGAPRRAVEGQAAVGRGLRRRALESAWLQHA